MILSTEPLPWPHTSGSFTRGQAVSRDSRHQLPPTNTSQSLPNNPRLHHLFWAQYSGKHLQQKTSALSEARQILGTQEKHCPQQLTLSKTGPQTSNSTPSSEFHIPACYLARKLLLYGRHPVL